MNTSKRKTRIKDIAELAGVSMGTVDRVLHNRGEVSEGTRQKVMQVIDKLNYKPNIFARSLALKKHFHLAFLIPDHRANNFYWEGPLEGIAAAADEIKDFNASVMAFYFDMNDPASFTKQSEKLLENNPDGVLLAPVSPGPARDFVQKLEVADIPYVFIDSNLEGQGNLGYIGQNTYQSGYLAAHIIDYGLPVGSQVLIAQVARQTGSSNSLLKRVEGFRDYFKEKSVPGMEPVQLDIARNEMKLVYQGLEKYFSSAPNKIGAIFVPNSKAYMIARYLEETKRKDVTLVGYDLLKESVHYLKKGTIDFLIAQNPEEQGYMGIMALFNYLVMDRVPKKTNYRPIDIITRENVDYYLKD
jgi:LacI family transcriptional regulator